MNASFEIYIAGLSTGYEAEHLARLFFPAATLCGKAGGRKNLIYARAGRHRLAVGLRQGGSCAVRTAPVPANMPAQGAERDKALRTELCAMLYRLLCEATGERPPWGMLIGVRPLALFRKRAAAAGEAEAARQLAAEYDVSEGKLALLRQVYRAQQPLLAAARPEGFSLYISIPFCPSRCHYCSFVSRTIEQEGHLADPYLAKLDLELAEIAAQAGALGLCLQSIYVGGGTPTALDATGLKRLLRSVQRHFGSADIAEYTVEAGRPDCTDAGKLALLHEAGVTRVSVNPQSMRDEVLRAIGRRHSAADIQRCFADARKAGFGCINADVIAGLPHDDEAGFAESLGRVLALGPENITVHTLTRKRASNLVIDAAPLGPAPSVMIGTAYGMLKQAGYGPYYLYRQKNGVQNLENTGWAKPGHESLYNVAIMEERQTILAAGAGAVTKLVGGNPLRIQRQYNPKYPLEYLKHFDEVILNKRKVREFYARNLDTQTAR